MYPVIFLAAVSTVLMCGCGSKDDRNVPREEFPRSPRALGESSDDTNDSDGDEESRGSRRRRLRKRRSSKRLNEESTDEDDDITHSSEYSTDDDDDIEPVPRRRNSRKNHLVPVGATEEPLDRDSRDVITSTNAPLTQAHGPGLTTESLDITARVTLGPNPGQLTVPMQSEAPLTPSAPAQPRGRPPPPPPPPLPPTPVPYRRGTRSPIGPQPLPGPPESPVARRIRLAQQNSSSDPGALLRAIREYQFPSRAPTPAPAVTEAPHDD